MVDYTVEAIVVQKTLQAYIDRLACLVDEAILTFDTDGLQTQAVDPANVAMANVSLQQSAFESWSLDRSERVGIDVDRLDDVLGLADSGSLLHLRYDAESRRLHVQGGEMACRIATIDPDAIRQEPDIPELDLPAHPTLTGSQLDRAASGADIFSDHVVFGFDADSTATYVEAQGDTDDVRFEWGPDEMADGSSADGHAHSLLSLDYVTDVVGVLEDDETVQLELGEEMPVRLVQAYADGAGRAEYMISPRIKTGGR